MDLKSIGISRAGSNPANIVFSYQQYSKCIQIASKFQKQQVYDIRLTSGSPYLFIIPEETNNQYYMCDKLQIPQHHWTNLLNLTEFLSLLEVSAYKSDGKFVTTSQFKELLSFNHFIVNLLDLLAYNKTKSFQKKEFREQLFNLRIGRVFIKEIADGQWNCLQHRQSLALASSGLFFWSYYYQYLICGMNYHQIAKYVTPSCVYMLPQPEVSQNTYAYIDLQALNSISEQYAKMVQKVSNMTQELITITAQKSHLQKENLRLQSFFLSMDQVKKRKYRKRRTWLQKKYCCAEQNCRKRYSSRIALNSHYRKKHGGSHNMNSSE